MNSRIPILIVFACLVVVFIAFEVHSVIVTVNQSGEQRPTRPSAPSPESTNVVNQGDVPPPTIPYPELCQGIVELDKDESLKLTPDQKKKVLAQLEELDRISERMHRAEEALQSSLDSRQKAWIEQHGAELREASVQGGDPPITHALEHFKGSSASPKARGPVQTQPVPPPDNAQPPPGGQPGQAPEPPKGSGAPPAAQPSSGPQAASPAPGK